MASGEVALLLGASGSGKSTLLRILNNLETIQTGTILLDDKPITPNELSHSHQVGMVFQQFNLFENLTVLENITFPLIHSLGLSKEEANKQVMQVLGHYGLADKAHEYTQSLSGGQKQRLAIARTLALKPKIVCLDEPTSALDPLLTTHVAQSIQQLAQEGYIVLVASHDTKLIHQLSCTIYLLKQGTIQEIARSEDFEKNPDLFPEIKKFIFGKQ